MSQDRLTYDELKEKHDTLQRQATHALVIGQDLVNAKHRIDRELSRFRAIQFYSERVIQAADLEEFNQLTVEAIIEAFEFECSALLSMDGQGTNLEVKAAFGCDGLVDCCSLPTDWLDKKGLLKGRNAFIEDLCIETHPWARLGLCQVILCPYLDSEGDLRGFVLGGRTEENKVFYDELTREVFPSIRVFSQQMSTMLLNFESKEFLEKTVKERTEELSAANINLSAINQDLEGEIEARRRTETKLRAAENEAKELSEFLKKTFGRYISKRVMNTLLEDPSALKLGGERRSVTMLSSDLRGFTAISENLEPEQVVTMLNNYFEVVMKVISDYGGVINDVIGDALLVFFGAPQRMPDRTERAVACAIAMQNAMGEVSVANRLTGLPELEMGIGIHNSEVVVGNIGSRLRTKYSVVGSGVNRVTRIEGYTVGGQILASEPVFKKVRNILRVDSQRVVHPKGYQEPIRIYEVGGIAGDYNLVLEKKDTDLVVLVQEIPFTYAVIKGKHIGQKGFAGQIVKMSKKGAEIILDEPVEQFSNLQMNLQGVFEELAVKDFTGKVIRDTQGDDLRYQIRFTSMPLEVGSYFLGHRQHANGQLKAKIPNPT